MKLRVLGTVVLLAMTAIPGFGGARGPGNYAGVVLFDRWGTCYLFSGVYLMYISSQKAASLQNLSGKPVVLNAKEVFQPMNPGDGLISSFDVIGEPTVNPYHPESSMLKLTLSGNDDAGTARLVIFNAGPGAVQLDDDLGLALFGVKGANALSPSNGASDAWITRAYVASTAWGDKHQWHINVDKQDLAQLGNRLPSGRSFVIRMNLRLPPGQYDLVCGYGGDVHEYYCSASNLLPITATSDGAIAFK